MIATHNFINTVFVSSNIGEMNGIAGPISEWLGVAVCQNGDQEAIENVARGYLNELKRTNPTGSSLRYRFHDINAKEALLKLIFERAFRLNPEGLIAEAEKIHETSAPFHPRWRKVVLEDIPGNTAKILNHTVVKVIIAASIAFAICNFTYDAYEDSKEMISGKAVPWIINNTSLDVIRLGNKVAEVVEGMYANKWQTLMQILAARFWIERGPNIPYVTPFCRNLTSTVETLLFPSPVSLFSFVWEISVNTFSLGWNGCEGVSNFLADLVLKENHSRLAVCKDKTYQVWLKCFH